MAACIKGLFNLTENAEKMPDTCIVVATENPVKLRAVSLAYSDMFPGEPFIIRSLDTGSGVSDQPMSDEETLLGAETRSKRAMETVSGGDLWVGIEGGVQDKDGEMTAFAWVSIRNRKISGKGRTGTFFLPPEVRSLIRNGRELGDADDMVFRRQNSKQEEGAIGLLTGRVIDRTMLYRQAVILALIPFKNPWLYQH